MRQPRSSRFSELKKSAADGNTLAIYPTDFMRLSIASRTDSSSSTIEITGIFATLTPLVQLASIKLLNFLREEDSNVEGLISTILWYRAPNALLMVSLVFPPF